eukprot:1276979-Amphidinium_carterae.1
MNKTTKACCSFIPWDQKMNEPSGERVVLLVRVISGSSCVCASVGIGYGCIVPDPLSSSRFELCYVQNATRVDRFWTC